MTAMARAFGIRVLLVAILTACGASRESCAQKDLAKVNAYNGVYVFTDCTPVQKYDVVGRIPYLGAVENGVIYSCGIPIPYTDTEQYPRIRNSLVTLALGSFADVGGIMVSTTVAGQGVATVISFKDKNVDNSIAKVNAYNGVYVFTDCTPLSKYTVLGKRGRRIAKSNDYSYLRDRLLRLCKRRYPETEGIILTLVDGGKDKAQAITFSPVKGRERAKDTWDYSFNL